MSDTPTPAPKQSPKILSKAAAAETPPDTTGLPPPGDARREFLQKRADELQAAMETMALEREALDPSRYKPIREIQYQLARSIHADIPISNADPDYEYCLVRFQKPQPHVDLKKTQMVWDTVLSCKVPVWEVVQGDMREMIEARFVDGTRVIADTLLMRGRKDRVAAWREQEAWQAQRAIRREHDENAGAMLERARGIRGVRVVETAVPDPTGLEVTPSAMRQALVKELGGKLATEQLKTGTVPGAEMR